MQCETREFIPFYKLEVARFIASLEGFQVPLFCNQISFLMISILLSSLIKNAQLVLGFYYLWGSFCSALFFLKISSALLWNYSQQSDKWWWNCLRGSYHVFPPNKPWNSRQKPTCRHPLYPLLTLKQPIYSSLSGYSSADTRLSPAVRLPRHGDKQKT